MEVAKFKRIVIQIESDNGDIGLKRSLKPARYYSDLQAQVETFHPGYTCILSVPNTKAFKTLSYFGETNEAQCKVFEIYL
jgi:hypothetical protein